MSLGGVAIMQTGSVLTDETVITPTAPVMRFNTDPVANGELIHGLTKSHNSPGPLVTGSKGAIRQRKREMPVVDLEVGATGSAHGHPHQHLARPRLRHGAIDYADVLWAKEYRRSHRSRERGLLHNGRKCQGHGVLHIVPGKVDQGMQRACSRAIWYTRCCTQASAHSQGRQKAGLYRIFILSHSIFISS